jgi:WD40 repeat protein
MPRVIRRAYLLHFTRASQGSDASVELPRGDQEYHLRGRGQSTPDLVTIRWNDSLLEQLEALREHSDGDVGEAAARVGRTLAKIVDTPSWTPNAQEIAALSPETPVFLTVRSDAAELYLLPWELLRLGSLAHAAALPKLLIRYELPDVPVAPRLEGLSVTKRGRVIFAWSAAGGKVDAARHVQIIEKALDAGRGLFDDARDRGFTEVKNASRETIRDALERAKEAREPVAILHLLCHGAARDDGTFGLALDGVDGDGSKDVVTPSGVQRLLREYAGLVRLVVISACDSGNAGAVGNALGSVAHEVYRAGFAAVIASRFPLSWDGARAFAAVFYERLAVELDSLEDAFLAARAKLSRMESHDWASLQLYARESDGDATHVFNARPYQGLAAFKPEHARFFFGREREIREVMDDLDALVEKKLPRFLVVSGASGTGKSSMVLGGVIPRWKSAARDGGFAFFSVTPGASPEEALAKVRARLEIVGDVSRRFVVVVDQFEEVFTHRDPAGATALVRGLWALASEPDSSVCVIATLRVDFLARCNEIIVEDTGLRFDKVACDPAHQVLVAQMSPEQLRETIEKPAEAAGITLEAGLADTVIRDVEAAPGALPLMSHALYLLWKSREGNALTLAAYKALGSVQGALDAHAEEQLKALPDDTSRAVARRLMVSLVHAGTAGAPDTRRRRDVSELRAMFGSQSERFEAVLGRFVAARLLVTGGGEGGAETVEVAHEALVRSWKRFKGWIDEDRVKLAQLAQVELWVREWKARPDALLGDSQLGYVAEVEKAHADELTADMRALLRVSRAVRTRARRVRRALIAGAVAVLAGFGATGFALWLRAENQRKIADRERANAVSKEREAKRNEAVSRASELRVRGETPGFEFDELADAVVLRQEVARRLGEVPPGVDEVLFQTSVQAFTRPFLRTEINERLHAFSPDGSRFAAASGEALYVWDTRDGRLVATCAGRNQGRVESLAFSRDGARLVAGFTNNTARSWNARDGADEVAIGRGEEVSPADLEYAEQRGGIVDFQGSLWLSSDGELALLNGRELRRTRDGAIVRTLDEPDVLDLHLTPGGESLMTLSPRASLTVWDLRRGSAGEAVQLARKRGEPWTGTAFAPDGSRLVTRTREGAFELWDVPRGTLVGSLGVVDGTISAVPFPSGRRYFHVENSTTSETVGVWDVTQGRRVREAMHARVWGVSPDAERLIAIEAGRHRVNVTPVAGGGEVALRSVTDDVLDAGFIDRGVALAVRSPRGLYLWTEGDGAVVQTFGARRASAFKVVFAPDGASILTISGGATELRDAREGSLRATLASAGSSLDVARFAPDGQTLLMLHGDSVARLWSVQGGPSLRELGRWQAPEQWSNDGAPPDLATRRDEARFSPDGARALTTGVEGDPSHARDTSPHEVRLWDVRRGQRLRTLPATEGDGVATARFMPGGARVFTTHGDLSARIWDANTGEVRATLPPTEGEIYDVWFSSDGARVVTAHARAALCSWSASDGRLRYTTRLAAGGLTQALFSPDGARVFTTSSDHVDRVWEVATGTLRAALSYGAEASTHAVFIPGRARLVTAYSNGTLALWSTDDGRLLATIPAHLNAINDLAVSPDGLRLATASDDGTVRLWNLDPTVITRAACERLHGEQVWSDRRDLREACASVVR